MARVFREETFGPADETITYRTPSGFTLGKIAVFGRLTGSGGSASLRVYGSFVSPADVLGGGGTGGDPGSANESQTLDFGGIITNQFWLGSLDISELGNTANPEFIGQDLNFNSKYVPVAYPTTRTQQYSPANVSDSGGGLSADDIEFNTYQRVTGARTGTMQINANGTYDQYYPEQDFTLTFNGNTTSTIIASSDMTADIQAALIALVDFDPGDVTVTRVSATIYTVTFGGAYANQNAAPITINQTGFTPTGVTESAAGGSESEEITDTAALGNPISQIVADHENKYPYLTLVFGGDNDPGLEAEAYVVFY